MSRQSTPSHAQMAGDLGFAVQFNAETLCISAIVPRVTIGRVSPFISRVRDLMSSNTLLPVI